MFESHCIFNGDILLLGMWIVAEIVVQGIMVTSGGAKRIAAVGSFLFLGNSALVTAEFVNIVLQTLFFHYFSFLSFEFVESLLFDSLPVDSSGVHVVDKLVPF